VREEDGLAMSSRNARLGPDERKRAVALSRALRRAEEMLVSGERSAGSIVAAMIDIINESKPGKIDYISIARYSDLALADAVTEKSVIALAVFYGATRLIDNMIITFEGERARCAY